MNGASPVEETDEPRHRVQEPQQRSDMSATSPAGSGTPQLRDTVAQPRGDVSDSGSLTPCVRGRHLREEDAQLHFCSAATAPPAPSNRRSFCHRAQETLK
ncbi:unnamed protein product [Pleuronectes platessa]|uniref:Uncharacterized protein n=1 Tax=Pleuronectes platessa TaxID=8262 RepID=A0A9N7VXH6_PLEPL|nr:unnamed protein product [Pleuronectes platessa]